MANSCDVVRSLYLRAMEVVEPPSKTRPRFQYTLLEEYPLPLPAADEDDPLDVLRTRVFRWAKDRGRKLGDFRSPQWTSRGYVLVGKCVKHTDCHAGKGRHFKFHGGQAENLRTYILSVWTSGTCSGEDRVLRPTVACGTGPTHQDREDVLHIADQLLARNVPCTPTNVSGQLKRLIEPKHIAAILRQRRRQFGRNASQWAASIPEFEAWAVASSNDYEADLRVARYEIRPEVRWVLLLRPFWEKLQELLPEPLVGTSIIQSSNLHIGFLCCRLEVWNRFCLVAIPNAEPRQPHCTCWLFAWRGACVHCFAALEILQIRSWSCQPVLAVRPGPRVDNDSEEDAEPPARRRRLA